ncbi:hypothetical protein CYR40_03835 [Chimaeribacter arupi]|uniref:Uncharacterized protein n=3 Tax=Enterobacterales TaxID=91347 RepID=A0A2N5ET79_9GAMM|nr:hypothetical protein [Nissabacter archeti]PLR39983.1 hypothetical protein CYR23_01190 [Chimaeribacter arupi]PLR49610.1 hypothetical protein CYR40_03835 [Chimaeribacter arupi]PLR51316.1 hypothetical protein CYR52_09525 [Chimaeribacter arupi]PLR53307.1 hypothetical protein CYR34_01570 [Chimaeribacter arupi]
MRTDVQFSTQHPAGAHRVIVGDIVRLETHGLDHVYLLDVMLARREGETLIGNVVVVSPAADIPFDHWELKQGEEVAFHQRNIIPADQDADEVDSRDEQR